MTNKEALGVAIKILSRVNRSFLEIKINKDNLKKDYPNDFEQVYAALFLLIKEAREIEIEMILYGDLVN